MWLFFAELIYCDCSMKIQNKCLILEISLCNIFRYKLNLHIFKDCSDVNGFPTSISVDLSFKDQLYLDKDLFF